MAADHGDGAAQQGVGSGHVHNGAHADGQSVLDNGDDTGHQPVDHQHHAALLQQLNAGAQTHGGEEGQHEGGLEGVGEVKGKAAGLMAGKGNEHEQETADHGGGDAVLAEERDLVADKIAEQQQHGGHSQSHDRVSFDMQHILYGFKRH